MGKVRKAWKLLLSGDFATLWKKTVHIIKKMLYRMRARIEDWRIGRISLHKIIPTKYAGLGAYSTESTDYCWLDQIFKSFPLQADDVFVDVGCGEGRVLTYLYLRGFRGPATGVELDPDIAQTAVNRTRGCANIQIHCGNILEAQDIIKNATAIYMFNPFDETMVSRFADMIEEICDHPVTLYYCNDFHRKRLDKREKWYILRRNVLYSPVLPKRFYTVYRFRPE